MKKIKYLMFMMAILLIPSLSVYADTFTPSFSGDEIASVGDTIKFTMSLETDMNINSFSSSIKYDSDILTLKNVVPLEDWVSVRSSNSNELDFSNKSVTGNTKVFTLKFYVKNNTTEGSTEITIDDLKISSTEETPTIKTSESITKTVKIKSDDNTVKSITIDDKAISGFSSSTYNYTLEVSSTTESVKIGAVLNNKSASFVEGYGERTEKLEYGSNEFKIKVKSESGKEIDYTITVVRKDDRVVDNDLKSLIINGGDVKLSFDPSVLSYTVKTYKLEELNIEYVADDEKAKVKVTKPDKLVIGENKITITVTAVTGDKKDYTIILINRDERTDTRLKNLSIKGQNLNFDPDKYTGYKIRYSSDLKDTLVIYKQAISSDTEVLVRGLENIKVGSKIEVVVTAIDGSGESIYTIDVVSDERVNFFFIVEIVILVALLITVIVLVIKKNKKKKKIELEKKEEELSKTKEITF